MKNPFRPGVLLGTFLWAFPSFASYYGVIQGGTEIQSNSPYQAAFTNNSLTEPKDYFNSIGIRLGNESATGVLRMALTAQQVFGQQTTSGNNFGEISWNRWGGIMQINVSPTTFLTITFGGEAGYSFSRLMVLSSRSNGMLTSRAAYIGPVLGLEALLRWDLRLFAEASYPLPFGRRSVAQGDALGAGSPLRPHLALSGGLSFYFSR